MSAQDSPAETSPGRRAMSARIHPGAARGLRLINGRLRYRPGGTQEEEKRRVWIAEYEAQRNAKVPVTVADFPSEREQQEIIQEAQCSKAV